MKKPLRSGSTDPTISVGYMFQAWPARTQALRQLLSLSTQHMTRWERFWKRALEVML